MAKDRFESLSAEKGKDKFQEISALHEIKKIPMETVFERAASSQKTPSAESIESPIYRAFKRGGRAGVSGLLAGYKPEAPPNDENWLEYLAALAGEVLSDTPAFMAGGELGVFAGASLGSIVPGLGTTLGALGGGGAGAMALPSLIKHSFQEYRDFVDSGGDLTFGGFLERAGRISKETGKAATVGLVTAGMSKFLPFLKKIPKFAKFLNTKPGRIATATALEYTGLTGTQAALEGELPSAKQLVGNAFVLGGLKAARGISGKAKGLAKKAVVEVKIKAPEVKSAFIKTVKDILPVDWEKRAVSKAKTARYEELLKDYLGSKNAKIIESKFKWQEKQAQYEKSGGKFTPKQLEDMLYYSQKTGNPEHGFEDSFTDVSERLPKHAKEFITEVLRPHLKKSLQEWNDNPVTKNINPREGLEEYYLPGMYEAASKAKIKAVEHKIKTKFKIKNPFSDPKSFMTYNEAALEAGLKPRYKNPIELMKQYDQVNIKLTHNAELLDMIKKFQTHNNENIIVTSDRPREYAKAAKEGYVEFEDPFLRSFKDKDGQYQITHRPALVEPEFAKSFSGVFSKEAFRPDSTFWKVTDKIKNQMNFMRVAASPFHYIAEMESILGQRGLKGFNLTSMATEGRSLRNNKAFMMDAARHGLKITNRLGVESLRKGNSYLERGLDYLAENRGSKAAASIKKGMTYLFDEFIPNAKAVSYKEAIENQLSKFKKQKGRSPDVRETKSIKRTIAEHMNNIYGGQNWEQSKYFRDPIARKKLRRVFAFVDWTVSALKQAAAVTKPGLEGKMARRYMAKYLLYTGGISSLLRTVMGGLEQTDEENKSAKGIRFNPQKAVNSLVDVKSLKDLFSFTLPDLPIRYGKGKDEVLNMGRDDKGVRFKGHFGKQLLEIFNWVNQPITAFFAKANPVFTTALKQAFGVTPSAYGPFVVERAWFRGRPVPWKGKRGAAQLVERAKSIIGEFVPFGMRGGAKKWVASFGGAFPISKEYTTFKSEDDIENALLTKDKQTREEKLGAIKALLKINNFSSKIIDSTIKKVRNQLIKDGQLPEALTLKKAEPKIREFLLSKDIKALNALKKELLDTGAYTSKGVRNRISRVRNVLKRERKLK